MKTSYYYMHNDDMKGPVNAASLAFLFHGHHINAATAIKKKGTGEWLRYEKFLLNSIDADAKPAARSSLSKVLNGWAMLQYIVGLGVAFLCWLQGDISYISISLGAVFWGLILSLMACYIGLLRVKKRD